MKRNIYISIVSILIIFGIIFQTSANTSTIAIKKYVALTFDDGPNNNTTPILLDILKSKKINATFFLIGQNALEFSGIVKRIYDEGNIIGNHTRDHIELKSLSNNDITDEILKTQNIIGKITGYTPILFRPPYGAQNKKILKILRVLHLSSIQRSLDSSDWKSTSSESLTQHIMNKVRPGSIILMHDTLTGTVGTVAQIIDSLSASGYTIVTVDKLLGGSRHIRPGYIYR